MSIVTTDNRFYSEIAAAIREKNGESTLYLPADMAAAILAIKGGGDAYAAISVTYPEGSVCTCTQPGQTPLTAGDTSGAWLFVVPVGGEWTITSTDPVTGETASTPVVIENQYEMKSAVLSYWTNQLYEDGNEFVSVTGGWGTRAWRGESSWIAKEPTVVKNADHMELTWSGSSSTISSGALEILKDFDFTPYSSIELTYDKTIASGGQLYAIVQNRAATNARSSAKVEFSIASGTGTDIVSNINIASVSGSFDFAFITRTTTSTHSIKIKKVLLF